MTKTRIEEKKISDLVPDSLNINAHTQRGRGIVEHSVRRYGIGRGIVAAGKGTDTPQIIGGHLTHEVVGSLEMDDVIFVHTNGEKLIVTVRDDIAPNSPEAIALGLIDNEAQKQSYNVDVDILAQVMADPATKLLREQDKMYDDLVDGIKTRGGQFFEEELEEEHLEKEKRGNAVYSLTIPLSKEERDFCIKLLNDTKKENNFLTSIDALLFILRKYADS